MPHTVESPFSTTKVAVLIGLLFLASLPSAYAATYYVSTTGADSSSGSRTAPFLTIQHAATVAKPGDTILVANGIYSTNGSNLVDMRTGGKIGLPIVIQSQNKYGAKLSGNNNTSAYGFIFEPGSGGYVRVQDFEIYGFGTMNDESTAAFFVNAPGIDIKGNLIHDIGNTCNDTSYGQVGIYAGGGSSGLIIEQNIFHDIGRLGPGQNGCNPQTTNYKNHDHGIYLGASSGPSPQIVNNLFYNINRGWGIQIYPGPVNNALIAFNTFAGSNPWRNGQIVIDGNMSNGTIVNNVFYNPRTCAIDISTNSTHNFSNMRIAYNMTSPALFACDGNGNSMTPSGIQFNNNMLSTNPQFISSCDHNFSLLTTSPAINSGIYVPNISVDINGNPRPLSGRYDLGAFEVQ